MTVFGRSDAGMLRYENEDAFGECEALTPPDISHVESIADGNDKLYDPEDER